MQSNGKVRKSSWCLLGLLLVSLVFPNPSIGEGTAEGEQVGVNVPGKWETWFGTANPADVGSILDRVALPPDDPRETFKAHGGRFTKGLPSFTLRTPRCGRMALGCGAIIDQGDTIRVKYQSAGKWIELPPARIPPDYFRDWDKREFIWWVEIPDGQTETRVEVAFERAHRTRVYGASIAEPRINPALIVPSDKHPYLFVTEKDLPAIRARSQREPTGTFREALRRGSRQLKPEALSGRSGTPTYPDRVQTNRMEWAALEGVLSEDPNLIGRAKQALLNLSGWTDLGPMVNMAHGGVMRTAAITYDLLHDKLSPDEREKVERFLVRGAKFIYAESTEPVFHHWIARGTRNANWRATIYSGLGMVAMAMWNTHPDASKWLADATETMKDMLDYDFDTDGAIYEAFPRYGANVEYHSIVSFMEALRRVTGEDLFGRHDRVLHRLTPFVVYMLYPTLDAVVSLGDTSSGTYSIGLPLLKAAVEYDDGLGRWYLNKLIERGWEPGSDSPFYGTIWGWEQPPPAEDPDSSVRLSEAFAYDNDQAAKNVDKRTDHGSGHVFLRSGFTHDDDIYFACQAGDNQGFHGHADQGSYVLAGYGVKFLRDFFAGAYEGAQFTYRHSGQAHQTVLIDGAGQGAEVQGFADTDYQTKIADVEVLESHMGYDYVRMNLLKAYRHHQFNRTMQKAMRHVVFVRKPNREGYFVVIDDLKRDDDPHTYSHPFHYEPEVKVKDARGGRIVLSSPKASLHIAAVVPEGFRATRETKYRDNFVLLTCTQPAVRFVMVTVLYPVKGEQSPPGFLAVSEDGASGVEIDGVRIVFDKSTDVVSVSGNLSNVRARVSRRAD